MKIIVTDLNGEVSAHFVGCEGPEEYLNESSGDEKVLSFLDFPAKGEQETDGATAVDALIALHTHEEDSICQTLERLLTRVFEEGRRCEKE